jgi:diacylglycerol kinase (ATP)
VNTWNGLRAAASSEAAFRLEIAALVVALPVAFIVGRTIWVSLGLIAVVLLVMIVELLNTAIEKLSDRVTIAMEPAIGAIKDMGSAAVGLSLVIAAAVWLVAIIERLGLI